MSQRVNHIRGTTTEVESVTPQVAELGFDTTRKEAHIGDGATAGGLRLAKKNMRDIVVAAQISANTNDYNPASLKHAGVLVISTDAARDITGLAPSTVVETTDGREITLYNGGAFNATLKDQSASSGAANRFDLGGADLVMAPKTSVTLRYRTQGGLNRWELVAQTVGAAVGAGAVLARTLAASSQGFSLVNGVIVESRGSGAMSVAIKTLAGGDPSSADPVLVLLRDATLATGGFVVMTLTAATSLTVSSGSSLGATSAAAFRLWLVGLNDAGTFRLGIINCGLGLAGPSLLATDTLISAVAEGGAGAADNIATFYANATVTSKPFEVLGYLDYPAGLVSAGAWSAAPTTIQLYRAGIAQPGDKAQPVSAYGLRSGMINGRLLENRTANAATFAIKTQAGADPSALDPVRAVFQDGSGGYVVRDITAALSLTLSSGSTMGFTSSVAGRLWLTLIDTGAGVVLGAINCLSGTDIRTLYEGVAYSSTAEGGAGAADNAQVIYSAAVQTAKYICLAGYADYDTGLASAGAWASAPSRLVLFGPGVPRPGELTGNRARSATGAATNGGTVAVPKDDTKPQISEGDEYLSKAITPSAAANVCRVTAQLTICYSAAGALYPVMSLFRDSGPDALATTSGFSSGSAQPFAMRLDYEFQFNASAPTGLRVRGGCDASTVVTFNGAASNRLYGGAYNSFLQVEEIMG